MLVFLFGFVAKSVMATVYHKKLITLPAPQVKSSLFVVKFVEKLPFLQDEVAVIFLSSLEYYVVTSLIVIASFLIKV